MKKAWILIIIYILYGYYQVLALPQSGLNADRSLVQEIIINYGEVLNLTEEQKSELVRVSLEQRREMRLQRLHPRRNRSALRRRRNREGPRNGNAQQYQNNSTNLDSSFLVRGANPYYKVYEILMDEQTETLKTLLIDREQKEHEYRTLRYIETVYLTGIKSEKIDEVLDIFESHSQAMASLEVSRIQSPDETDREKVQETIISIREGNLRMKEILTAAEYEMIQRQLQSQERQQLYRNPTLLSRVLR